jgi:hypothetical protein
MFKEDNVKEVWIIILKEDKIKIKFNVWRKIRLQIPGSEEKLEEYEDNGAEGKYRDRIIQNR